MERPGFLEFAVYGVVLTVTAGWVYGLPPFDYEAGDRVHFAHIEPTSAGLASEQQPETAAELDPVEEPSPLEPSPVKPSPVATELPSESDSEAQSASEAQSESELESDEQPRTEPPPDLLVVTARSLNMRAAPNAGSAVVGTYPRGAPVEQIDVSGNWVLVRTEDEATGWMYSTYLDDPDD